MKEIKDNRGEEQLIREGERGSKKEKNLINETILRRCKEKQKKGKGGKRNEEDGGEIEREYIRRYKTKERRSNGR